MRFPHIDCRCKYNKKSVRVLYICQFYAKISPLSSFLCKTGAFFISRLSIVKGTFRRKDAPYQMKKPLYIIRCKKRSTSLLYLNGGEKPLYIIRYKMSPSPLLSSPWQATAFPMDNDCFLHAERRMDRR